MRVTFNLIRAEEGIGGLWAGAVPTSLRVGLGCGIYFTSLELCLAAMQQQGVAPGCVASHMYPVWKVKHLEVNAPLRALSLLARQPGLLLLSSLTPVCQPLHHSAHSCKQCGGVWQLAS